MLESLVSSLLTKYLGDYIEGLDSDNLNIGVTSGNVVLTNLRLKKSALESLELPIIIKEGMKALTATNFSGFIALSNSFERFSAVCVATKRTKKFLAKSRKRPLCVLCIFWPEIKAY
jgi:hypothetical protein